MPDREKVIKGLECCTKKVCIYKDTEKECPYLELCGEYEDAFEDCTSALAKDALALLKAQEPLLVTHIHEEYPEHLWIKDENGNVNEWAMEFDYHQGPVCERCGDTFCIHCEPDGYITHKKCVVDVYKCPKCGSELWSNQKHCAKCGQAVKWDG